MKLLFARLTEPLAAQDQRGDGSSRGARRRRLPATTPAGAYYEQHLRDLLERVREAFSLMDAGQIDAFALDELITHYRRCADALWEFCGLTGPDSEQAARTLAALRAQGGEPDWWQAAAPPSLPQ